MKAKYILFAALGFAACSSQNDGDIVFSDTEKAIIKTLVYADPADDPTNAYDQNSAAATLGQQFFWDTQFSGDILVQGSRVSSFAPATNDTSAKKINCAACHSPTYGWADNASRPNATSLGVNFTSRNSPTILNTAHNTYSLWDGAVDSLWGVARPAIEGNPHGFYRAGVAYIICNSNTAAKGNYRSQHDTIFGTAETAAICGTLTAPANGNGYGKTQYTAFNSTQQGYVDKIFTNFGKAIAAYERLIVSKNSAFDRWAAGSESAMSVSQKRGLKAFIGKGNCIRCHSGPNFSDGAFHNLGVPQVGGFSNGDDDGRFDGITTLVSGANAFINSKTVHDDSASSTDRVSALSATSSTVGQFKTPTLRSVSQTGPYFHNGTFNSLWDVVNFYNFAGNAGNFPGTKDTILTTRRMTNEEMEDIMNFLNALDGETLSTTLTTSTAPTTASW